MKGYTEKNEEILMILPIGEGVGEGVGEVGTTQVVEFPLNTRPVVTATKKGL